MLVYSSKNLINQEQILCAQHFFFPKEAHRLTSDALHIFPTHTFQGHLERWLRTNRGNITFCTLDPATVPWLRDEILPVLNQSATGSFGKPALTMTEPNTCTQGNQGFT